MPVQTAALDWDIVNADLTTTYAEVTYTRPIKGYLVQSRGDQTLRVKRLSGDTKYWSVKGGSPKSIDVLLTASNADSSSLGFWAVEPADGVGAQTETLEAIVVF